MSARMNQREDARDLRALFLSDVPLIDVRAPVEFGKGAFPQATNLPLTIGFGISKPEHVAAVAQIADGVVVASALINHLDTLPTEDQPDGARSFVRQLAAATHRAPHETARG